MNLQRLPKDIGEAVKDLTKDYYFQKKFEDDDCLDRLDEEKKACTDERDRRVLLAREDYRICELVADALVERGKLDSSKKQWFIDETKEKCQ